MQDITGYIRFIEEMGLLKDVTRTAYTCSGKQETTAEHSWRLAVFAGIMLQEYPQLDACKVLMMALFHDVGEIYEGDQSAALQPDGQQKFQAEERAMLKVTGLLEEPLRSRLLEVWREYEEGTTAEARLVKALDKAETIIQHNQGKNPAEFDYEFNLGYGRKYFENDELLAALRERLDADTAGKIKGVPRPENHAAGTDGRKE